MIPGNWNKAKLLKNMPLSSKNIIWIDLENSPHVPFFKPIISELERRGFTVMVTCRDAYQTRDLADFHHLSHTCIGKHYGKTKILKILGVLSRAIRMALYMRKYKPGLAICHGSRSHLIASKLLNIKSVLLTDYEYTNAIPFINFTYTIIPIILAESKIVNRKIPTFFYHGIKEDVYVPFFKPGENLCEQFGIADQKIVITIRPPATEAHYHVAASDDLFIETIDFLKSNDNLVLILLPRSHKQRLFIESRWGEAIQQGRMIIPPKVIDGLELIWASDLVISGGGTMNREAAALNVSVYSIFRGKIGAVDKYLHQQGRLFFINDQSDLEQIKLVKRDKRVNLHKDNNVLNEVVTHILNCV